MKKMEIGFTTETRRHGGAPAISGPFDKHGLWALFSKTLDGSKAPPRLRASVVKGPCRAASIFISISAAVALSGCVEPNYRNEVTATGQGGVEVHRVPKDPAPDLDQPSPPVIAQPAPAAAPDPKVADLEAQVRELKAENARLKNQNPTTAP